MSDKREFVFDIGFDATIRKIIFSKKQRYFLFVSYLVQSLEQIVNEWGNVKETEPLLAQN